ncbi:MAG: aldehyde dehydrogenase family protein [Propionibacteriaceae bacterium]|nr:aldehyde dehydrogenase family protein [Propionibacteriaceae bacterium]
METYAVHDPATLHEVGRAPQMTDRDVDAAVATARAAQADWSADREARRAALLACATRLRANAPQIGELLSREQGKPVREAVQEALVGAGMLEYYAELAWDEEELLPPRADRTVRVQNRPVGVVATITPWNFPLSLLLVKLAPALVAGCTVVSKPSESTPLSTMAMVETMCAELPPGVLQYVTGTGKDVNVALSEHPDIAKLSFTGSTGVGVALMTQAAPSLKRLTMELGGNDPAILLEDADPGTTARGIVSSAFRNAGQVCMAVKRVYAPRGMADDLAEALAEAANRLVVGRGLDPATTMGPLHNQRQLEHVGGLVRAAETSGARVVAGGGRGCDLPGYFLAPTVVAGADDSMGLVSDEQFGAALPVVAYDDLESTVAGLNRQPYGLGASIWSPDLDRATAVAETIEAGTVWVNQHTQVEPDAAFGGWRHSGFGRERGPWGLAPYLEQRTLNVRTHTTP